MAGLTRGDHRIGRAAGPLGARASRVEPEAQRDADRVRGGPQERNGAVDAAAHRDGDPPGLVSVPRTPVRSRSRARRRRACRRAPPRPRAATGRRASARGPVRRPSTIRSPLERQPDGGVLVAARGVSDQLEPRHAGEASCPRICRSCRARQQTRTSAMTAPSLAPGHSCVCLALELRANARRAAHAARAGPVAQSRLPTPGHDAADAAVRSQTMKGSQKPKKMAKKPPQKSLKERRSEKRAAAKTSRSLDV